MNALLAAGLLLAAAGAASADEPAGQAATRSEALEAERERRAAETSPPTRSAVEKALHWYDNQHVFARVFGGWNGVHFASGNFPAGAGTTYGIGYDRERRAAADPDAANRLDVSAVAARSTRGYNRATASAGIRRLGGAPLDLHVRGQRFEFPQEDFFGSGMESSDDDRTSYLLEGTEAGLEARWRPVRLLDLTGGVFFVSPTAGTGTDSRYPSIEQVFDPAALAGFGREATFLRGDTSIALDWRDNPRHPHAGGRYSVQLSTFQDRDADALGFNRVSIDLQQYVPLPHRQRTLALRAAAVFTDPRSGQDVPFYYQPTLGGSQQLRGFREFRFRDRNSLALTAEYRWEAWWALDGALFVDAGTVAHDRRSLSFRDLEVSYGAGFRLHSNDAFVTRLDLAFSREGFVPLLRFEHVF